ncbi:M50 family metallopeptidase, partial [Myxococcota bacterium]|nr:M50 family metallopeptidase [Myxococcota bacterium]
AVALGFFVAIAVHELGHFGAARALHLGAPKLVLQLGGGSTYVRDTLDPRAKILTLLAGPAASFVASLVALLVARLGLPGAGDVWFALLLWTIYQLMPFPPLDGGLLLRLVLAGRFGATLPWRLGWVLGLLISIGLVALDSALLQPVVLLAGLAIILGRAESGYVRHLDAYEAWQRGDHKTVVRLVEKLPDYLEAEDKTKLHELGIFSAMELADVEVVEAVTANVQAHRPVTIAAAEWLLVRGRAHGAKLAEKALDALDQELVRPTPEERERFADLAFRYAIFEVRELRADSGLGLLERAIELGFSDLDRLEADGELAKLADHPRHRRAVERLRAGRG